MKNLINYILQSNFDLSQFSNNRLKIEKTTEQDQFLFSSSFKVCGSSSKVFASRYIAAIAKDKGLTIKYFAGLCSSPHTIIF